MNVQPGGYPMFRIVEAEFLAPEINGRYGRKGLVIDPLPD